MSEHMTCPACDATLSGVLRAFRQGNPCPECDLPRHVAVEMLAIRSRGADAVLLKRHAEMAIALAETKQKLRFAEARLDGVRCALEEE